MLHRKGVAGIAVCAALACAGMVRGETGNSTGQPLYLDDTTQPATAPASTTPPTPLMGLLEKTPVGQWMDNIGLKVGGFIEGGYTAASGSANVIAGRVFDTKNEHPVLDQVDFYIDRAVDPAKAASNHTIDIGAHFEVIYGWDSGLIHSNGLYDAGSSSSSSSSSSGSRGYYKSRTSPENQFDINQAYAEVALPIGNGLQLNIGKFVSPLGYEVINPTGNPFYSHSYLFGFAIPYTQTGVVGIYKLNADWTLEAGITRGWNQSLRDNNGDPDLLTSVTYTPQESDELKKWTFIANLSEGPQATGDNGDWWSVIDLQAVCTVNSNLKLAANVDYGDAPHVLGPGGSDQWYGIAGYASYTLNDYVTLNGRGEYYGDMNGFTLGAAGVTDLYEATFGATIKPMPHDTIGQNLVIRPEVRGDYANSNFFNNASSHYQFTFGIDAYFIY